MTTPTDKITVIMPWLWGDPLAHPLPEKNSLEKRLTAGETIDDIIGHHGDRHVPMRSLGETDE